MEKKVFLECCECLTFFKYNASKFNYSKKINQKNFFCSKKCQYSFRKKHPSIRKPTLLDDKCFKCGKNFKITKTQYSAKKYRNSKKSFCSLKCKNNFQRIGGELSPSWKGGRRAYPSQKGYVMLRVGLNKRMFEHRFVAEKKIGRKLRVGEVVHHLNGKPNDNRPENLVVCKSAGYHTATYHRVK